MVITNEQITNASQITNKHNLSTKLCIKAQGQGQGLVVRGQG